MNTALVDVEMSPNVSLTWGVHEQDVLRVLVPRTVISYSIKRLGTNYHKTRALPDFKGYKPGWWNLDSTKLMESLWDEIAWCDLMVGHNLKKFDRRRMNRDAMVHNIFPPRPYRCFDTLTSVRSVADFNSNRLGDVCEELGIGSKMKHPGLEMWEACVAGNRAAWKMMKLYNAHDVDPLLEGLYLRLRPWDEKHPSNTDEDRLFACPRCRSPRVAVTKRRLTATGPKVQYVCSDCGKYSTLAIQKVPKILNPKAPLKQNERWRLR